MPPGRLPGEKAEVEIPAPLADPATLTGQADGAANDKIGRQRDFDASGIGVKTVLDLHKQGGAGDQIAGRHVHSLVVVELANGPIFEGLDQTPSPIKAQRMALPLETGGFALAFS